jgi:hypothetical protein
MLFYKHTAARTLIPLLLVILALWLHFHAGRIQALASQQATDAHSSAAARQVGHFDGPAELPRIYIDSSLHATPAPGKTVMVRAGEDPSQALSQASCGDTVQLQAGATFDRLDLPEKKCDDAHWIIIRTSAPDAKLPPEGTRLTPCYAGVSSLPGRPALQCASTENVLAKIEFKARSGNGPVRLAPGANHYRLIGLEITRPESPAVIYNLAGPDTDKKPADHIIFDRMWFHGTAHNETVRGIMLSHVRYAAVVDSYFSDFHCVAKSGACVDSQAVAGGNGDDPMGPFKIVNNFLEAAGENIIFGGAGATTTPADIEVRHNHMFKPMAWMKGQPGFVGGVDGSPFIVKNLFEMKNAQRVLFEGNILENSWGGFSQTGYGIVLTPKNQQWGQISICPDCQVLDITIRNCTISHVGSGLLIGNGVTSVGAAAKDGGRYSIHDIVVDDIQTDFYNGFGTFAQITTAVGDTAAPRLHDVAIDHVTAFPSKSLFIIGGPRNDPRMSGISITNSIFTVGTIVLGTPGGGPEKNCAAMPRGKSGDIIFHACFSSFRFEHNVLIDGGEGWPKDNQTPRNAADVGFSNYADGKGGDYRLSKNSKFKHTASDQKDPGADLDAIDQATKGIR